MYSEWVADSWCNSSLPRSDAHQGKFLGLINVGSGLTLVEGWSPAVKERAKLGRRETETHIE